MMYNYVLPVFKESFLQFLTPDADTSKPDLKVLSLQIKNRRTCKVLVQLL